MNYDGTPWAFDWWINQKQPYSYYQRLQVHEEWNRSSEIHFCQFTWSRIHITLCRIVFRIIMLTTKVKSLCIINKHLKKNLTGLRSFISSDLYEYDSVYCMIFCIFQKTFVACLNNAKCLLLVHLHILRRWYLCWSRQPNYAHAIYSLCTVH